MKARCGLEDCDCGYTIEKLAAALERAAKEWYHGLHGLPELFKYCERPRCVEAREAIEAAKP